MPQYLSIQPRPCYSDPMQWDHEYRTLISAIRESGDETLRRARDGFEVFTKPDQSPVTSADLAVNEILQDRLRGQFPDDGWLSEESPDSAARLSASRVWVIDPIDGTKAFIRREPEFCVSVALVEGGQPILAAILKPSTGELYTARRGQGLQLNESPVPKGNGRSCPQPIVALGQSEMHHSRFKLVAEQCTAHPMHSIAWAIARTASGAIHGVMTFELPHEWDVAAGVLMVEEAGGSACDGAGQPLQFNRPTPRFQGFFATAGGFPGRLISHILNLPHPTASI